MITDQMARPDEESLAVLFSLGDAQIGGYTITSLHLRLPRILRDRWSEFYLAGEILRPLITSGHISSHRDDRHKMMYYEVTAKGREALA